jgi:CheY-like chemotaxis protein
MIPTSTDPSPSDSPDPTDTRPKVLCVDDEPKVLEGLELNLRRRFNVRTATSGAAGLAALQRDPDVAVIVSDMRMPGMDGAQFLSGARAIAPEACRVLLTGNADIEAAATAVNDGQVFRFLTKPCPPSTLVSAIDAAARQHELLTAEKTLLEQTLNGCLKTMTDILALASPRAFGRSLRVKTHALELAEHLGLTDRWQLEAAAIFSQLSLIALPLETLERLHQGKDLSEDELSAVNRLPGLSEQWLANIPRLEAVRAILTTAAQPYREIEPGTVDARTVAIRRSAAVLRVALDFNALEARGISAEHAISTLRNRAGTYDATALKALAHLKDASRSREEIRELPLSELRVGMVLADNLYLVTGPMLVAHGYEVTERFVERTRNFAHGMVREPVRVIVRTS